MPHRLFITDFDGVICDSVIECLLVTHNAYHTLHSPTFQRSLSLEAIPLERQRQFRALRPYLKGAEDFVPMYMAIEKQVSITSQPVFNNYRTQHEAQFLTYQKAFYAERDYLQRHEKDLWLRLNPLFDGIRDTLLACKSFDRIHILTTKRQQDVVAIFDYQQVPFPADHIFYMKAAGKPQKLLDLLQEHDAIPQESVYIEDQVDFLVMSKARDIGSYLVEWGYVSEEQKALARQHAIPVIGTKKFAHLLEQAITPEIYE
jgi:phosphoglycolate phosphatase-like HAD superfamily hydrolase